VGPHRSIPAAAIAPRTLGACCVRHLLCLPAPVYGKQRRVRSGCFWSYLQCDRHCRDHFSPASKTSAAEDRRITVCRRDGGVGRSGRARAGIKCWLLSHLGAMLCRGARTRSPLVPAGVSAVCRGVSDTADRAQLSKTRQGTSFELTFRNDALRFTRRSSASCFSGALPAQARAVFALAPLIVALCRKARLPNREPERTVICARWF
jgi:hypothetical protein